MGTAITRGRRRGKLVALARSELGQDYLELLMHYRKTPKQWGELPRSDRYFLEEAWRARKASERKQGRTIQDQMDDIL